MHEKEDFAPRQDGSSAQTPCGTAIGTSEFLDTVLAGLSSSSKYLSCKYFYDERGSELFDRICELDEYYPTRTELLITRENAKSIAAALGDDCALIEFGSGSSLKTRVLLDELSNLAAYLPVDVSEEYLLKIAARLRGEYPDLEICPIVADFTKPFELPEKLEHCSPCVYFPGSTIGNFERSQAVKLLRNMTELCGTGGKSLIGFDLQKAKQVLELAYDDPQGVTAEFNLNLLARINRELDGDFELEKFQHHSCYNESEDRVEIFIRSLSYQVATVAGQKFEFAEDELIFTEHSHKYTVASFSAMAAEAGMQPEQVWTDSRNYFALMLLTCK
ncbi:MAG: L-histidine N(alpha)-methyltransferase [Planctomycetota bacterium]|nr:L-histidine N(alpha)-methyltransferase [Planctomycetota bacterium]